MKPSQYIKKGWCQEAFALDKDYNACPATSEKAVQWCAKGSAIAAYENDSESRHSYILRLEKKLTQNGFRGLITVWNDDPERTQEEVVTMLENVEADIEKESETIIKKKNYRRNDAGTQ